MSGEPQAVGAKEQALAIFSERRVKVVAPYRNAGTGQFGLWRAGFSFGPEPAEITLGELGATFCEALEKLLFIAESDVLTVTLVGDEERDEMQIGESELELLRAAIAALRLEQGLCPHCGKRFDLPA